MLVPLIILQIRRGEHLMKCEINIDDQKLVDRIVNELRRHDFVKQEQHVTVVYNAESAEVLYTVQEVSELLKTNITSVYELIKKGLLPALKLGRYKIRRIALLEFLEKYEGKDLTDLDDIKDYRSV
jgi:excisionase family DNA binding protein